MIAYEDTISDFDDFKRIVVPPYSEAAGIIREIEYEGLEEEFMEYLTRVYGYCTFTPSVTWWERYIIENEEEIYKELGIKK